MIKQPFRVGLVQMSCPDQPGLVRELSGWVAGNGGNIVGWRCVIEDSEETRKLLR